MVMRKLKMDLDSLSVETFATAEAGTGVTTVKGHASYAMGGCNTGVGVCHPTEDTEDAPTANATCPNTCWNTCFTTPEYHTCAGNYQTCMDTCMAYTPGACTLVYCP